MSTVQIQAVPTNIITGFLGVGKTTAILHLMANKPSNERWAVLVNEFGEIGVDGSLLESQHSEKQGVFIREVPGGCMCCAAGLPMQHAINQLLTKAKPDRLLIEPTGLGHPKEVLEALSSRYFQAALSLQKTLTLVDARKLSDTRYTNHDTFNQQIAIADVIIGNKLDLYNAGDKAALVDYANQHGEEDRPVIFTQNGELPITALNGPSPNYPLPSTHHHESSPPTMASDLPIPECGFIKANNEGEGFTSVGWRFAENKIFDHQKLFSLLSGLQAERMKAVFITNEGVFGYNLTYDALVEMPLDESYESRIEIISKEVNEAIEKQLFAALVR